MILRKAKHLRIADNIVIQGGYAIIKDAIRISPVEAEVTLDTYKAGAFQYKATIILHDDDLVELLKAHVW